MPANENDTATQQLEVIDKQRALDLLDKALTERGEDYVYPQGQTCSYFIDGQPSCIVGHALAIHGMTAERFDLTLEGRDPYGLAQHLSFISPDAVAVWGRAQRSQDSRRTWGEAVAAAHEAAANL